MLLLNILLLAILAQFSSTILKRVAPLFYKESTELVKIKRDLIKTRTQLSSISAQDEFAKWAKLRRALDKLMADYQKLSSSEASARTSFQFKYNILIKAVVYFIQIGTFMYFRSTPMFYLPSDWVGPFSYILRLPFAPVGSVSVVYWYMACQHVLNRFA